MNHDILPCDGKHEGFICPKRDTCLHYRLWLKYIVLGREMWSHVNAGPCVRENYKLYMEDDQ